MNKRKIAFVCAIVLVILGILSAVFYQSYNKTEVYSLYAGDEEMWQYIFGEGENYYKFDEKPLGVILPHHMIVAYELAKFYNGLSKVANPSTVYVIGPNHYETGAADIQTCDNCIYKTTLDGLDSNLVVNKEVVKKLARETIAEIYNKSFEKEHSIFSHAAYIKRYFPDAKIVPIILQWEIPEEEVLELSSWLNENLSDDDLVVVSVDFSHYQTKEVADFHDQSSFTSISNFDLDNVYDLEIDSPSSIYLLLDLMKKKGYEKTKRFAHTNLQDFMKERQTRTTSHQFIGFFLGKNEVVKGISVLSFGNPQNKDLGLVDNWNWDRDAEPKKDDEDRFLTGSDFNVFDLDDGKCETRKQNGLTISFCKFSEDGEYEEDLFKTIKTAKSSADFVYLLYQFSEEDLTKQRKDFAKKTIDNGVDIFIGRGIKEVLHSESYHGKSLFYSLGDTILGLYLTPDKVDIYNYN
ncbi:MAG: AmmeMemoRadiSam system protein B [Candidatus Gracilibacteria bacterium]|jgi:AmmeMemoRadiSam system protein B